MFSGMTWNERQMLSLGIVDPDIKQGDVLTLVWGEENGGTKKTTVERHKQTEIRVKVSPVPYAATRARPTAAAGACAKPHDLEVGVTSVDDGQQKPPFPGADVVGSLLRTAALKQARAKREKGEIDGLSAAKSKIVKSKRSSGNRRRWG